MQSLRQKFESDTKLYTPKTRHSIAGITNGTKIGKLGGDKMTQHFAKIHEPNKPQKSEVINVQQVKTPEGKVAITRTSSTLTEKDPSGHTQTIKFVEKEKYHSENGNGEGVPNDIGDKSHQFTQNAGQDIAKKLTQLGSSGKITISSKIIKNGEVTTFTKVTNFGPKFVKATKIQLPISCPAEDSKSPNGINNDKSMAKSKLMHSPSTIKDLLLKWCRDKTVGYPNVEITNFSRSWANGLAFSALVHSYYPDAFDFDKLDQKNRHKNLDLAFKIAEEKADIFPLLEVEDMIEMKDTPDWKCVFTYVQSLYKGLKDKKHRNPYDPRLGKMNGEEKKNGIGMVL